MDVKEALRLICKVPLSYSKFFGQRLLATAEVAAIRLRRPVLCAQKNFVAALQLPWTKLANRTVHGGPLASVTGPRRDEQVPNPTTHTLSPVLEAGPSRD
ncbi:unnamed protein product [Dibothriocephalus latus]|uniref:Uncharacterized protein n=1 Tax=Dibothriocephalus latus TaxID=60516 RepID=A0A3P6TG94_DIBLA|nr:unnamed protein product [Dibothriocephalus latus]